MGMDGSLLAVSSGRRFMSKPETDGVRTGMSSKLPDDCADGSGGGIGAICDGAWPMDRGGSDWMPDESWFVAGVVCCWFSGLGVSMLLMFAGICFFNFNWLSSFGSVSTEIVLRKKGIENSHRNWLKARKTKIQSVNFQRELFTLGTGSRESMP